MALGERSLPRLPVEFGHGGTSIRSDTSMALVLPGAAQDLPNRVELVSYCAEPLEEYIATLRWLPLSPHTYKTWVAGGHPIPNGNPPAPLWGSPSLDPILLTPPIIRSDQAI